MFQGVLPGKDFGKVLLQKDFRKSFGGRTFSGGLCQEGLGGGPSPEGFSKVLRRKEVRRKSFRGSTLGRCFSSRSSESPSAEGCFREFFRGRTLGRSFPPKDFRKSFGGRAFSGGPFREGLGGGSISRRTFESPSAEGSSKEVLSQKDFGEMLLKQDFRKSFGGRMFQGVLPGKDFEESPSAEGCSREVFRGRTLRKCFRRRTCGSPFVIRKFCVQPFSRIPATGAKYGAAFYFEDFISTKTEFMFLKRYLLVIKF